MLCHTSSKIVEQWQILLWIKYGNTIPNLRTVVLKKLQEFGDHDVKRTVQHVTVQNLCRVLADLLQCSECSLGTNKRQEDRQSKHWRIPRSGHSARFISSANNHKDTQPISQNTEMQQNILNPILMQVRLQLWPAEVEGIWISVIYLSLTFLCI